MKFELPELLFVFDVEAIGLHGEGFAVAGGIYDKTGHSIEEFAYHCPPSTAMGEQSDRDWVAEHVTIHQSSIEEHSPFDVRERFWWHWIRAQDQGAIMFVECGWPVEARFLAACIDNDPARKHSRQNPYPVHEISTVMACAGMNPMKTYNRLPNELPAHEPLADARLSARLLSMALQKLKLN